MEKIVLHFQNHKYASGERVEQRHTNIPNLSTSMSSESKKLNKESNGPWFEHAHRSRAAIEWQIHLVDNFNTSTWLVSSVEGQISIASLSSSPPCCTKVYNDEFFSWVT
jgi:hypothetical protein